MKKISVNIWLPLLLIIMILAAGGVSLYIEDNFSFESASLNQLIIKHQSQPARASLNVNFGHGLEPLAVSQPYNSELTIYQLLAELAGNNDLEIKSSQYDFGLLIEGIGDFVGGQDGKYWIYYVNGQMADTAIDNYKLQPGDKIEFKFEATDF